MFADPRSQEQLRWLPEMMGRLSALHGFTFIDLGPRLQSFTARTGQPVSFDSDYHWNRAGHEVAAEALLEALQSRSRPAGRSADALVRWSGGASPPAPR